MSEPVPVNQPLRETDAKLRRSRILNLVLAAALAFMIIVFFAQMHRQDGLNAAPAPSPSASESATGTESNPVPDDAASESSEPAARTAGNPLARNDPADPLAIGDPDAPVVLIEWADMRCPFCAAVANDTLPTIIDEYVETGKVRIEFHDVAFFGEESARASAAVQAAAAQDRGMEYVAAVFAVAPASGHPELPEDQLIGIAEQVGVADIDAFTEQLRAPEGTQSAQQATAAAQQIGVNAVPFFFDGSVALSGAQPLDTFRSYLDEAVAAAQ